MMMEQMARLRAALDFGPGDSVASWLPMYHDMGLIACLWFPLWHEAASTQFSASDWLLHPDLLFEYLERYHSTFCWLPNFAFSYLAGSKLRMRKRSYSLGHVRGLVNCSEPVRWKSMRAFAEAFAEWGVREKALQASYAMAENVFAVTQTPLDRTPSQVSRSELRTGSLSNQLAFDLLDDTYVSSGRAIKGMRIRIQDPAGEELGDLQPGEILLHTPCLFDGYWGPHGFERSAISVDGWYSTGDYGFLHGGDLYVIGRLKDIIIVGGQNIFPEDVEGVVNTVPGIYPGRVVSFGMMDEENGTETLAVVAEMKGEFHEAAARKLEREIQQLVLATIGVAARYAAVVPERWIVKSTAGKISRRETRERFAQEKLRRPAVVKS
jgi:acyl-CoA synthetase (AMP-forming)/AMP-acid ligase II